MRKVTIESSHNIIKRYENNPILSAKQIPYESELVFNAGVAKYNGKYVMVFRNDYGYIGDGKFKGTNLGLALSNDGIHWKVESKPYVDIHNEEILRIYDPRLTVINGECYICFAADTLHGIRGGIAVTSDFNDFRILNLSVPDNRNMVLFPEKINDKYVRLERPFPMYGRKGKEIFDIWISKSFDLKYWGDSDLLLGAENVPYSNSKIGPAAPPIKTKKGWLTLFHAVDFNNSRGKNGWEKKWEKRYTVGVMLLDLDNPNKIIGLSNEPIMIPEADYEIDGGFRNNVIFPGGMILEDNGEIKIYYGAADSVECLAITNIDDLLKFVLKKTL